MTLRAAGVAVPLALGFLVAPLAPAAQPARKVARVGLLCVASCPSLPLDVGSTQGAQTVPFLQALHDAGYVDGKTVLVDASGIGDRYDQLPALAARLVRLKVDVILAYHSAAAVAAATKAAGATPVVMFGVPNALEAGLVASLARPGGTVTGLTVPYAELAAKQIELLKEVSPGLTRVAVLWNPGTPERRLGQTHIEAAGRSLGVQVVPVDVPRAGAFEAAFAAIRRERASAILLPDPTLSDHRSQVMLFALRSRLATIAPFPGYAPAGALMTYGPDVADMGRRAAAVVVRILKGTRPADIPVEEPSRYHLAVNLATAKALGLTIPPSVLARADEIIQ